MKHYHFSSLRRVRPGLGDQPFAHAHKGGHLRHQHRSTGLHGYGRTRKSLKPL